MLYVFDEEDIEIHLGNSGYIVFLRALNEKKSSEIQYAFWHSDFENAYFRSLLTPEELEEE